MSIIIRILRPSMSSMSLSILNALNAADPLITTTRRRGCDGNGEKFEKKKPNIWPNMEVINHLELALTMLMLKISSTK